MDELDNFSKTSKWIQGLTAHFLSYGGRPIAINSGLHGLSVLSDYKRNSISVIQRAARMPVYADTRIWPSLENWLRIFRKSVFLNIGKDYV